LVFPEVSFLLTYVVSLAFPITVSGLSINPIT
jgi:hypothetical protein